MSEAVREQFQARLTAAVHDVVTVRHVGVDAVDIATWRRHLRLGGSQLLDRLYTPAEIAFCAGRIDRLSSRLAGKEAVLKALGTGIRGISLREVEVVSLPHGKPTVVLHGRALARAAQLGVDRVELSLCHEGSYAFAVAAGLRSCDGHE